MYTFFMAIHVTDCVLLILVVLLQAGRGAGLQVFGGGGGDALFSAPTSTNFMKQFTGWLAAVFAVTSLFLTLMGGSASMHSVTSDVPSIPVTSQQPPAPPPASAAKSASAPPASGGTTGQSQGATPVKK